MTDTRPTVYMLGPCTYWGIVGKVNAALKHIGRVQRAEEFRRRALQLPCDDADTADLLGLASEFVVLEPWKNEEVAHG